MMQGPGRCHGQTDHCHILSHQMDRAEREWLLAGPRSGIQPGLVGWPTNWMKREYPKQAVNHGTKKEDQQTRGRRRGEWLANFPFKIELESAQASIEDRQTSQRSPGR